MAARYPEGHDIAVILLTAKIIFVKETVVISREFKGMVMTLICFEIIHIVVIQTTMCMISKQNYFYILLRMNLHVMHPASSKYSKILRFS